MCFRNSSSALRTTPGELEWVRQVRSLVQGQRLEGKAITLSYQYVIKVALNTCMGPDSSVVVADWTAQESNPGGGEIFHTRTDRPWSPPLLLYNG